MTKPQPPLPKRKCPICETWFVPARADAVYDKPECRQKAYRERKRGEEAGGDEGLELFQPAAPPVRRLSQEEQERKMREQRRAISTLLSDPDIDPELEERLLQLMKDLLD